MALDMARSCRLDSCNSVFNYVFSMKMIVYKLFRKKANGRITSLFINKSVELVFNKWLRAEHHNTKGFKPRFGWHCLKEPFAPHLTNKGRIWCEVEIKYYEIIHRPASQGGTWYLAKMMKINKQL